jgi:hypothetical protein
MPIAFSSSNPSTYLLFYLAAEVIQSEMSAERGRSRLASLQASSWEGVSLFRLSKASRILITRVLPSEIPINEYYEYFGPTYQLDVLPSNMEDLNTPEYLAKIKAQIFDNMRSNTHAPSVQMSEIPRLDHDTMEVDEDLDDPNIRKPRKCIVQQEQ